MLIFECLYILWCVAFAAINSQWIKEGKHIYHFWNGLIHCIAATVCAVFWWIPGAILILLNSRLFFDVSLNLFRGLPINYVPISPKSIADKIEINIFGRDGYLPKLIWLSLSISGNVIYYVFIVK